jgi:hypothetical protein
MKLNLSTEKGLKKFFKKVKDHSILYNSGVSYELKEIEKNYLL